MFKPTQECMLVANYIIEQINKHNEGKPLREQVILSTKRLQRLLYFCDVAYMKKYDGISLFKDEFYAWPSGPTIPVVYRYYMQYQDGPMHSMCDSILPSITDEIKCIVDEVLIKTRKLGTSDLGKITQVESGPWQLVYNEDDSDHKQIISKKEMFVFYSNKEQFGEKLMTKTKIIYGIRTTDDERTSTIKAYCATYDIALREAKKYSDWWSEKPDGEKNIVPIEVIVE